MRKKKIVWICNFANTEVANIIGAADNLLAAPWITELIQIFRNKEEIELSIISPNYYENKYRTFSLGNIKVYLYKYRFSFLPPKAYNLSLNYSVAKKNILSIINKIEPDLIHLHGSENPFYSISAIPLIDKYPVLISIQGFVFLSSKKKYNPVSNYIRWNRIRIEKKINTMGKYFTVGNDDAFKTVESFNNNATIFYNQYPTAKPLVTTEDFPEKKYDIVYFARISRDKGIEDLIEALVKLKIKLPNIKVLVMGGGNSSYLKALYSTINNYGLKENIHFAGFQTNQQNLFKLAAQARVSVLPTYFDGIPGSIREAMIMKLPVVAYAVGGIPTLNDEKECITLVEKNNINELIEKIELVLNNKERTASLVKNAFEIVSRRYDNEEIYVNMINIYKNILNC